MKPFSVNLPEDLAKRLVGPTGKFPGGKIGPDDDGELMIAVSHKGGKVIINFGVAVEWVGMTPEEAKFVADALTTKALEAIEEQSENPLTEI